jgi:hypothetical protein
MVELFSGLTARSVPDPTKKTREPCVRELAIYGSLEGWVAAIPCDRLNARRGGARYSQPACR